MRLKAATRKGCTEMRLTPAPTNFTAISAMSSRSTAQASRGPMGEVSVTFTSQFAAIAPCSAEKGVGDRQPLFARLHRFAPGQERVAHELIGEHHACLARLVVLEDVR